MSAPTKRKQPSTKGSPLWDIRYFECPRLPDEGHVDHAGTLFQVTPAMDAWAKRLVALCRQRRVSIGKPHHLYVCFSSALRDGEVRSTDFRLEMWQQYVACGLPAQFNSLNDEARAERVRDATIESLKVLAPKYRSVIDELAAIVNHSGDGLELLLLEKETRQYRIAVGHTIPPWPAPSEVWLTVQERATGRTGRCKLIETQYEDDAIFLVGRISLDEGAVVVQPRSSFDGNYYARQYNVSKFVVPIDALLQGHTPHRPSRAYRSRN